MQPSMTGNEILYEDNHLIIVNKKPSQIVQGDKTGDQPLSEILKEYIKQRDHKPGNVFLGVVHRLDRPVSGAVIFAKTSKALTRLNELLKKGEIRKTYWVVVKSCPPDTKGHLVHYLRRDEQKNKSFAYDKPVANSQKAELIYELVSRSDTYFLLQINLLTGRHHQIRAQLAKMGCPVRGDLKYGYDRSNPDGSIHLHSRRVEFVHPVKKEVISVFADPPQDKLWDYFLDKVKSTDPVGQS
jgi:23S rRNA pseudouridine1911/1915/1917 synthase